jgi:hypothetical protein
MREVRIIDGEVVQITPLPTTVCPSAAPQSPCCYPLCECAIAYTPADRTAVMATSLSPLHRIPSEEL